MPISPPIDTEAGGTFFQLQWYTEHPPRAVSESDRPVFKATIFFSSFEALFTSKH